jgi:hypothetical protein
VRSTKFFAIFFEKLANFWISLNWGKKKLKIKKKCYCISLATRTPIYIICRNAEISPKKCFFPKKKEKICEGKINK